MFYYLLAQLLANKNLYFDNICTEPLIDKIKEMHFLLKSVKKKSMPNGDTWWLTVVMTTILNSFHNTGSKSPEKAVKFSNLQRFLLIKSGLMPNVRYF